MTLKIFILCLLMAPAAHAEGLMDLTVQNCRDTVLAVNQGTAQEAEQVNTAFLCVGLLSGVAYMMSLNCEVGPQSDPIVRMLSMSGPRTEGALFQTFLNWANANPSRWGERMEVALPVPLAAEFPCGR